MTLDANFTLKKVEEAISTMGMYLQNLTAGDYGAIAARAVQEQKQREGDPAFAAGWAAVEGFCNAMLRRIDRWSDPAGRWTAAVFLTTHSGPEGGYTETDEIESCTFGSRAEAEAKVKELAAKYVDRNGFLKSVETAVFPEDDRPFG